MATTSTATQLLDRLQSDHDFSVEVHRLANDPEALKAYLTTEGFDVTDDEMRETFLERYGDQLTAEQLDAIAGGFPFLFAAVFTIVVVAAGAGLGAGISFAGET